ncbi:MAG: TonB-dependent receptor [Bdellovibrionota bacterium]
MFRHSPPAFRKESGRFVFGALALAAVLARPLALFAEEPPAGQVPEILVEGERPAREAPLRDNTAAASVIEREAIERSAEGAARLLDREPGVQVREVGGLGSFSTLSIRGSSPEQVRTFLDGVPLDRGTGNAVDLSVLPAEQLERIEVYRSVTPLSVGGSAIGGVVEFRTRVPEKNSLEALAGGGSYGFRRAGVTGAWVPAQNPWSLLTGLLYEGAENDYPFTFDGGTPANPADDERRDLENADFNRGDVLLRADRKLSGEGKFSLIEVLHVRETGVGAGATLSQNDFRLLELFTTTSAQLHLPRLSERVALEAQAFFSFQRTALGEGSGHTDDRDYLAGANADFSYYLTDSLRAEGFGEYRFEVFDPEGNLGGTPVGPSSRRHFFTAAGGLEWEPLPEKVLLIGQVRYEEARDRLRASNAGGASSPASDRRAVTSRAGIRWKAAKEITFSANAVRAVRLPNFTELFGNTVFVRGDPDLEEEKSWSADAGGEWSAGEGAFRRESRVSARYFFVDTKDLIVFQANSPGRLIVRNQDGSRTHGVELSALWRFPRVFLWEGNLTWLRARQKPDSSFEVQFSPEWQAYSRLTAEGKFSGALNRAGLWADFEYVAENFLGQTNAGEVPVRRILGAGAFADFQEGRWSFLLEARNLTNEENLYNFAKFPLPGVTVIGTVRWRGV